MHDVGFLQLVVDVKACFTSSVRQVPFMYCVDVVCPRCCIEIGHTPSRLSHLCSSHMLLQLSDDVNIFISVFNAETKQTISDEFCVCVSAAGTIRSDTGSKALFLDLESRLYETGLYVVCRVVRVGRYEQGGKMDGEFNRFVHYVQVCVRVYVRCDDKFVCCFCRFCTYSHNTTQHDTTQHNTVTY